MYHVVKNNLRNNKKRIKLRIRSKVIGTSTKPRLSIFRSNKYVYGQLIDDSRGVTLVSVDSIVKDLSSGIKKVDSAFELGKKIAELAIEKGIKTVVFDRNRYLYHGRVAKFAEGAREGGLNF